MSTGKIKQSAEGKSISAPWYGIQRMLSYTIGGSGQVLVSPYDLNKDQIIVTALLEDTAKALASTLKLNHSIGNVTVNILVMDINGNTWTPNEEEGTSDFMIKNLETALVNNPSVYEIQKFRNQAAICCTPSVVQFYNDDTSNPDAFSSMLSSNAFQEVFRDEIEVYTLGKKIGNF